MLAAITHGGLIRRGVARTGGIVVALIGHLAMLSALGYQQAPEPILGERPTAIAVDIVSAPAPQAATASRQPATADDDSRQNTDSIDLLQTTADAQQDEPPAATLAVTTDPAVTTATAAKHLSSLPKAPARQVSSTKRQSTPLAIASASNPHAAPGPLDGESTGAVGVTVTKSNVPSSWKNKLLSPLDRYKHYPDAARAQRQEGTALLSFGMDRDGRVLAYYLVRSSGCPELDDEVLAMIVRASPLPPAPPELNE